MGNNVGQIKLRPRLQLGCDPSDVTLEGDAVNQNIRSSNIRLDLPLHMYVYCDLIEPQMVGVRAY